MSPLAKDAAIEASPLPKVLASVALVFVVAGGSLIVKNVVTDTMPVRQVCTIYDADGGYREAVTVVAVDKASGAETWAEKSRALLATKLDCRPVEVSTWEAYVVSPDLDAPPVEQPPSCACAPRKGTCLVDGKPAPVGTNLEPGTWSGGCVVKGCIELNGTASSWPAECGSQSPGAEP